ncbi:MAG: hypothetical protein KGL53_03880 [Elusimicrobia bacterium]|nr:hypothetical protein [Elusimicrobiota bacterium]
MSVALFPWRRKGMQVERGPEGIRFVIPKRAERLRAAVLLVLAAAAARFFASTSADPAMGNVNVVLACFILFALPVASSLVMESEEVIELRAGVLSIRWRRRLGGSAREVPFSRIGSVSPSPKALRGVVIRLSGQPPETVAVGAAADDIYHLLLVMREDYRLNVTGLER